MDWNSSETVSRHKLFFSWLVPKLCFVTNAVTRSSATAPFIHPNRWRRSCLAPHKDRNSLFLICSGGLGGLKGSVIAVFAASAFEPEYELYSPRFSWGKPAGINTGATCYKARQKKLEGEQVRTAARCERRLGRAGDGRRHFQHYPSFVPCPAHNRVQLSLCTQGQYTGHTWNRTSKNKFIKNIYLNFSHLPIYLWECMYGEVRGQLEKVGSLQLQCGSQGLNSGC